MQVRNGMYDNQSDINPKVDDLLTIYLQRYLVGHRPKYIMPGISLRAFMPSCRLCPYIA